MNEYEYEDGFAMLALCRREKRLRGRVRELQSQLSDIAAELQEARVDAATQKRRGDLWKRKAIDTGCIEIITHGMEGGRPPVRVYRPRHGQEYHDIVYHGGGYNE